MTLFQYLLSKLAEECNEVGQAALKAQQNGLASINPKEGLDSLTILVKELNDILGVCDFLEAAGVDLQKHGLGDPNSRLAKMRRVITYMQPPIEAGQFHPSEKDYALFESIKGQWLEHISIPKNTLRIEGKV